jgi:putative ABC transport system permease protein
LLAAMLLAAALALPIFLSVLLSGAQRLAKRPLPQWFWADTRQQLPGLSLALMALMLALAANIGVGTMVGSFRQTFTRWLDQRLASELYLSARDMAEAARISDFLAPRVDAILPIWHIDSTLLGQPAEVFGVSDHPTYRDNWPILTASTDVWESLANGSGILVNEQLSRRENLSPGDTLEVPNVGTIRIVGVYSDYGNPNAQAILGLERFDAAFPDAPHLQFAVRLPAAEVAALITELTETFDLPSSALRDQASIKAQSVAIFERTFAVTAALNVLTLSVAGVALFASLVTLGTMRMAQLAPLWALGQTRRRLAQMEFLRSLMLACLTTVIALPVGLLLALILLRVINVQAFGWELPMHLFPKDWLVLAGYTVLAAALAAALPTLRMARSTPQDLLRVFTSER